MSLIRIATAKDLGAIVALEQDWASEGNIIGFEPGGVGNFAGYLDSSDRSMWVAESPSQIVGYVTATVHKPSTLAVVPPTERHIEIDDLYVAPACRSRSIGSELVETVLAVRTDAGDSLRDRLHSVVQGDGNHAVLRRPGIRALGDSAIQRDLTLLLSESRDRWTRPAAF